MTKRQTRAAKADPCRNVPKAGEVIAVVRSYPELIEAFRTIKARLGLSNKFCDDVLDYSDGRVDKILGPSQTKPMDALAFSMFCELFAVRLEMKVDHEAVQRMAAKWEGRELGKVVLTNRLGKAAIKRARPIIMRELGARGGRARMRAMTPEERSELARKANAARFAKRAAAAKAEAFQR